ncbi:hypothetical protein [Embleya sp. MST-111070]|uniref:hypothetical protein n=1 Tax=Embleya sp. MST-111070 TaxID=3398231 RepID=UPI003F738F32
MHDEAGRRAVAQEAVCVAVAAAYPLRGRGIAVKEAIDEEATLAIEHVLSAGPSRWAVAGCEGPRDGARAIAVDVEGDSRVDGWVYCDPIDGSLNAARGGPRSASALTLGERRGTCDGALSDSQSVFVLGSHDTDVSTAFEDHTTWQDLITAHARRGDRLTGLLNRADNIEVLSRLCPSATLPAQGSRSGFRPTLAGAGVVAVGDATITLPFECDLEFGRLGLVEAQIQSMLWTTWTGLLVSRDRIRATPGGTIAYIERHIRARRLRDARAAEALFTATEREDLACGGVTALDALEPLTVRDFGPGPDAVAAVGVLSSSHDSALPALPWRPDGARWDRRSRSLAVEVLTATPAGVTRERRHVAADHPALSAATRARYENLPEGGTR